MRASLLFALSSLGFFLPACAERDEPAANQASDILASDGAYFGSPAFTGLTPEVATVVRRAIAGATGPTAKSAMIALFSSPAYVELGRTENESGCVRKGTYAQLVLALWVESRGTAETTATTSAQSNTRHGASVEPAKNDAVAAEGITLLRTLLAVQPLSPLDGALSALAQGLTAKQVSPPLSFDSCAATTVATERGKPTTFAMNDPAVLQGDAPEALAAMVSESERTSPSRAIRNEWSSLRARYQAGIAKRAPELRSAIRTARREGSATLGRSGAAGRRFDQASDLVDRFVAVGVRADIEAMNLVHAVVGDLEPGVLRGAGQDVRHGTTRDGAYLPGAHVEAAVVQLFADLHARAGQVDAPELATTLDQRLISIHPYLDANGRTTRLMSDWVLARGGYPPVLALRDTPSNVLLWQTSRVERSARLERVTLGMRRTVELVETIVRG